MRLFFVLFQDIQYPETLDFIGAEGGSRTHTGVEPGGF